MSSILTISNQIILAKLILTCRYPRKSERKFRKKRKRDLRLAIATIAKETNNARNFVIDANYILIDKLNAIIKDTSSLFEEFNFA